LLINALHVRGQWTGKFANAKYSVQGVQSIAAVNLPHPPGDTSIYISPSPGGSLAQ